MVKYSVLSNTPYTPRIRIPLKLIIFWYKKIKSYINTQNMNLINSKECPTLYISKKYPRMSILELYQRINNHLIKYFPKIYHKLNSNKKRCLVKLKKETINNKEIEKKENNEKNVNVPNNEESNKTPYILISLGKKKYNNEKIKLLNEKSCEKVKHLFEPHKFNDEVYENYNNCYVKEILLDDNKNNDNDNNNENENENETSSLSIEDVSPIESTSFSSSTGFNSNRINYLTHFKNIPRKSKYFNNDDYYSNKLKSIGFFNNNK